MTRFAHSRPILIALVAAAVTLSLHPRPARAATAADIAKKWNGSVVLVRLLDDRENEIGSGSGFVIGPELVATCYHVVAGGVAAQVKTADRIVYPVTGVAAFDRARDLAILRVSKLRDVPAVDMGDSKSVKPGEPVVVMGSPLGLEGSISDGIVSGLRDLEKYGEVIQVSAPVSPGNSGGPLFNSEGRVIGVMQFTRTAGQNLNFGIPVNTLKDLMSKAQETPSEVAGLKAPQEQLLSEVGVLPARQGTRQVRIPKKPPYTVALLAYHQCNFDTLKARIDKRPLQRVTKEEEVGPGRFVVTSLGVLRFDAAEKDRTATVEYEYKPYRVAVFVAGDATGGDLRDILEDRLGKAGDETVVGAEVDAAVANWHQQGDAKLRELSQVLNCARLVVADLACDMSDAGYGMYGPMENYIQVKVELQMYDLNTGREVFKETAARSGTRGKLQGYRRFRKELAEDCVTSILGPPPEE